MVDHLDVRRGAYADAVSLMHVSGRDGDVDAVGNALMAMAMELNPQLLTGMVHEAPDTRPNEPVVVIRADDAEVLADAGRR